MSKLITFETAKLAKEKGYNKKSNNWYRETDRYVYGIGYKKGGIIPPVAQGVNRALAPTQSELQDWLREKHNIHIIPIPEFTHSVLEKGKSELIGYKFELIQLVNGKVYECFESTAKNGATHKEALDEGLKEALKLIEE